MKLRETKSPGVHVIEPVPAADDRGFFARIWDVDALRKAGLDTELNISAITYNKHRGTLRGMHFQLAPFAETKFVRVTRGAIWDVALDLRPDSPTYLQHHGELLSAENHRQLYIPKGCAHGYLTLEDHTELSYFLSAPYSPQHASGVRYNDPAFAIDWPGQVRVIAPRDAAYADYAPASAEAVR
jgi:dTDP-4-dehydrorhamnose 3,5-epimerase